MFLMHVQSLREVIPVDLAIRLPSRRSKHNPAGCTLLQLGQQQVHQVSMTKVVGTQLDLHRREQHVVVGVYWAKRHVGEQQARRQACSYHVNGMMDCPCS